jgi:hypothetical protein
MIAGWGMDRVQPRGRIRQLLALGAVLIALTAGYVLMARQFNVTELPSERHFGAIDQVAPAGEVYLEPISIDALDDAMQVRAYVSPSLSESKSAHSAPGRDLTLLVSHDNTVEEVKLAAGDHIASSTFEVDLMRAASRITRWTPMWRGSTFSSSTESPHSGSPPGSRCGKGRSGTACTRQVSREPIRMTFS